ncbi:hypothetical protein HXV90_02940 [Lysinibacillus sp. JK80]|uniref:hypothetical protein n=1 Tax=Lysinibacillus sp. JK80 TaxID=2749809 RepID=UPI0022B948E0|nr:hypothetical protein [Lysinibacillus sp. JK80]WBF54883.1 hypothetical protein HXV90_02940 [Lysinibacillus sp. JK80]
MRRRNGIPIDIPSERIRAPKVKTQKPAEYHHYNVYVTMFKRVDGHNVWTMVPFMHPDYKKLRKEGYRITEKWDKREVSA